MTLHDLLDFSYGNEGDAVLRRMLEEGADANSRQGPTLEAPLHVAARRRRVAAVKMLLDHGARLDAKTAGGKTAYAHAVRRGFHDITEVLSLRGASTMLNEADRLAVAVTNEDLDEARNILAVCPSAVRTGNAEEDRLLADVAGRNNAGVVEFLINAGANLAARGLDSGTPLHQACWFGQPRNARLLLDAGAPLDVFDEVHHSSPIGWAVHGSRYSGGAEERQNEYVQLVEMLLAAGASLNYSGNPGGNTYVQRLLNDGSPRVRDVLEAWVQK